MRLQVVSLKGADAVDVLVRQGCRQPSRINVWLSKRSSPPATKGN